jgi:hypothetical protein
VKSNLSLRKSTSTQIVEARDLPDYENEHTLDDVNMDHILRSLTGLPTSKIASLQLADEWD